MSSHAKTLAARLAGALVLVLTLAAALPALAAPAGIDDDPDALRERLLDHRRQEAETKARLWQGLLRAVEERTPNQDLYDVTHYFLDLELEPSVTTLTGTVTVTASVLTGPLAAMDLDLASNMGVSGATSGGATATWSRVGDVLTVDLDRAYAAGETVVVTVDYAGNPSGGSFGWDSHGGQPMIWTLSEPFGARDWWPCKDLNTDKADSLDMRVTMPDGLIVATNGLLDSEVDNGATRTFHWKTRYPIVTYLVSLAIHPYTVYSDWYAPLAGGDPMELQFFVYPDHYDDVQATYSLTKDMIHVFAQGFGEYPFLDEKYGHAEFNWGGGMEHQTLTSLGGWSEDLISHELAHQWWGDMITCADFHHIWLNEGFAVWCEAYWKEQTEGFATYQQYMDGAAYTGPGTIYVEDTSDTWAIFDSNLSYNKASWVVHMLRGIMGDADFFQGLADYRAAYGYASATTEQFRDVMEAACGRDLDDFIQQWIYGEYFPVYSYGWSAVAGGVELTVEQVQTNTGLFTLPIPVRVTTSEGVFDFTVENSLALETYTLSVAGDVELVQLDPDRWILRQVQSQVVDPDFDAGILVVNGVDWDTYDTEITSAYADSVFSDGLPFDFWDTFPAPAGGYVPQLPAPAGTGPVPAEIIGGYSAVVWVGNHYNGDLPKWTETPVRSYLEAGGNLLLLTRRSRSFLQGDLDDYLGIIWAEATANLGNCVAVYPGLANIPFTGSQSYNDVFRTTVAAGSTLLFEDTAGFSVDRGLGVHDQPAGGGTWRPEGAQFVHLAGRPYRMDHAALRANVGFILRTFFGEPWGGQTPAGEAPGPGLALGQNYPNPFNPTTLVPYSLAADGPAELAVYDAAGRLVRVLLAGEQPAGAGTAVWDGRDAAGNAVASGIYLARLRAGGETRSRRLVLLR